MKRLFLLATIVFLATGQLVFAEITSPYTLDEKLQVLFGDSTEVVSTTASTTYHGLQNYTTNYVNNYLHITFTYTHSKFAFSDYPPRLYITGTDPRATSTPSEKDRSIIYQLAAQPVPPGHDTDWYSYDVQFDVTGYTATVTQGDVATTTTSFHRDIAGLTTSDWAALANLYPINPSSDFSMSFTPLQIYETPTSPVATTTPVIIVPGIMGSYLNKEDNTEVWMNLLKMVLSGDDYLDDLGLSESGISNIALEATEIIRSVNIPLFQRDNFLSLIEELEDSSYTENEHLYTFPYDWRLDIEDSALELKEKIDEIKAERGVEKVDLVAHSMGGLLVKKYLKDYGGDSIEKFIDIGTPHTGSPNSFLVLMYGYTDIAILNKERIKTISQNMPSIYQLLPSENYFDDSDTDYQYYVFNGTSGNDTYTFDETSSYLKTTGRNSTLVDRADEFHDEIDGLNPADYGVTTYNIVGCGTPTIGQLYILEDGEPPIYNIRMINGDGTVPLKSAEAITASSTYYVRSAQHAIMPSVSGVKELIAEILTATSTTDFDISLYSNLATDSIGCTIPDGRIISFHSPIELHVYDSSGNHTGPNSLGDIESNISGVVYETIGDNKFAFLPNGIEYTIKGNATDTGTFDVRIQELVNGEVATTTVFADIPLSSTTQTQFIVSSSIPTQIPLDNDNDGTYESSHDVSTTAAGILEATGKIAKATQVAIATDQASSRPAATSTQEEVLQETATSSGPVIVMPVVTTTVTKAPIILFAQIEVSEPEETSPELEYETTAVVYKSFNHKVTNIFKKLWFWILGKM